MRGAAPTPLRHADPFRLVVPSSLSLLLLPLSSSPYIPPTVRSLAPFPISLPPCFVAVVRSGCCTILAAAFRRSSCTPPPVVLPSAKFSFRRARRSGYFMPFCRLLSCLPYGLHAAVYARRHTQRKQAYSRSCALYLSSSVSTFYTLKKSFAFYKKNLQKSLQVQILLLPLQT